MPNHTHMVLDDFVVNWINDDIKNLIDTQQCGFLNGLSTTHCLVKLPDDICKGTDELNHSALFGRLF